VVGHRLGEVKVGEASVVIAVSCPHRAEAFDACEFLIDELKKSVPIWKREICAHGERWV
jgi:molybdopterin synthase catalytic subunit